MSYNVPSLMNTYPRSQYRFERGEGVYLFDGNDRRYLDFAAGIAVNLLGHCHPHLVDALKQQADALWHISNMYQIPAQEKLATRLTDMSFADKVFFSNSGAEAMECAIKTARKYFHAKGQPEKYRIITFEGAFHGRTLATLAAGGQAKHLEGFGPVMEGFDQVKPGDHDALKAAITDETAAILIEPISGEGGVRAVPPQCLQGLRALCDEHNILLIFDEVQCGVGRSGFLFAHEAAGVKPDIMAIAKGIGGGFPLGACLTTEEAALGMQAGSHGSTYGGNPLAMAVGNAVLDIILDSDFLDHVKNISSYFQQRLASLVDSYPKTYVELRGEGLMRGIQLASNVDVRPFVDKLRQDKLLTVAAGENVLRLLPPLIIEKTHIDEAISILEKAAQ